MPDPTTPAPPLTDDATITPPEQPPMLDDEGGDDTLNGETVEDTSTEDLSVQGGD